MNRDQLIKDLLEDFEPAHSEFQLNQFIIGGEVDAWSKYKQALREIDSRWVSLARQKDELELFDLKKSGFGFGRKARIKNRIRNRARKMMVRGIFETERELDILLELAVGLKEKLGTIDSEKRAVLETGSWKRKALKMAGVDLITTGRLGQATFNLVLALPKEDRLSVLSQLKQGSDPFKLIEL